MKKLILLGLSLILFTACEKPKQQYFSESPEIDAVKAGVKAYESQDWDTWKTNFADTAKIYYNSIKAISPEENIEGSKNMLSNFSSYGFDSKETFIEMVIDKENDTWVNYWSVWKGKLAANDKEIIVPVHLTMQFVNGKIVKEYGYWDNSPLVSAFQEIEAAKMNETAKTE